MTDQEPSSYRFIDVSTLRKNRIVKDNLTYIDGIPMFSLVEFNIYGSCTRSCSFCPVSNPKVYTKKLEGIDPELFKKVVLDLAEINYRGKILFSAFSEPFMHKKLNELLRIARAELPDCRLEMVSNGDLVVNNRNILMRAIEAGLDTVSFSLYDGPEQMAQFQNMRQELGLSENQVILRRRYYEAGNYGMTISNRAGLIDSNHYRDETEQKIEQLPLKRSCYYPFYMTLIDYNGDMILCPHDWEKKFVVGNLKDQDIWSLWISKRYNTARKLLTAKNRNFDPCSKCDVHGDVIGEENFLAWQTKPEAHPQ